MTFFNLKKRKKRKKRTLINKEEDERRGEPTLIVRCPINLKRLESFYWRTNTT